jgi:hypothetical protein
MSCCNFTATFNSSNAAFSASFGEVQVITPERYSGEYEVTPSQSEQILTTDGLLMEGNVVVKPIPNNYGLITWNGSVLTVS